ncbi:MAG: hypothetical protein M1818_004117 [Claussenomyces sp. TS43310]|nr:MAG: hypothetical protein M1818_004117 [Claussenomyces sp. TS43310]
MFELFTFAAPATLSMAESSSADIPPCDRSHSPGPSQDSTAAEPRTSMTDLLSKLDEHSMQPRPQPDGISPSYIHGLLGSDEPEVDSSFLEVDDSPNDDDVVAQWALISARHRSRYQCRRLQRQRETQLLCKISQKTSIGELVDTMVSSEAQCHVTRPTPAELSQPAPISHVDPAVALPQPNVLAIDDDEGFCEGEDDDASPEAAQRLLMSLRRADGPNRMRRYARESRGGDAALDGPPESGLVRCPPRIRKRITRCRKSR